MLKCSPFTPTIRDAYFGGKSPDSSSVQSFLDMIVFKEDFDTTNVLDNATLFDDHTYAIEKSIFFSLADLLS